MRGGGILGVLVLVWLLIGVVAAYQRDYFSTGGEPIARQRGASRSRWSSAR